MLIVFVLVNFFTVQQGFFGALASSVAMPRGVVRSWFENQGYGFIIPDVQNDGTRYADDVFCT